MAKKVELNLLSGKKITAEHVATMFERLTGRKASSAEIEKGRKRLEAAYAKRDAEKTAREVGKP